jgi:hypothetical protein
LFALLGTGWKTKLHSGMHSSCRKPF